MPTLRERTSTSSAPIAGTSTSETTARRGSSKISAFIEASSSLCDQHLDLVRGPRRQAREGVRCTVEVDAAGDDPLDRQVAGGDLRRDAVEVVDPVAPRPDDRQLVARPEHRLDRGLADEQAGLRERAAPAERADAGVEAA